MDTGNSSRHVSITAVATTATDAASAPPAVATGGFLWLAFVFFPMMMVINTVKLQLS